MDIQMTFRHVDPSDALSERARERADKLDRYVHKSTRAHVTFEAETPKKVHLHFTGGANLEAEAENDDLYVALDQAFDKAEKQLRREHDKHSGHKA